MIDHNSKETIIFNGDRDIFTSLYDLDTYIEHYKKHKKQYSRRSIIKNYNTILNSLLDVINIPKILPIFIILSFALGIILAINIPSFNLVNQVFYILTISSTTYGMTLINKTQVERYSTRLKELIDLRNSMMQKESIQETSFEDIYNMDDFQKEETIEKIIRDIYSDIDQILAIKYDGYESDIKLLNEIAIQLLLDQTINYNALIQILKNIQKKIAQVRPVNETREKDQFQNRINFINGNIK